MNINKMLGIFKHSTDPLRQQAMADAYAPIIRSVLMIGCAYYVYVTWSHWQDESGQSLAILGSISTLTAFSYYTLRQHALAGKSISLQRLELASLAMNLLMYMNVLSYFMINFEQAKLG